MFSAWKAAYLASKLPLTSSADALTREITLESSCRHIHTSFLLEIQGVSYSKFYWVLEKLRTMSCICSGGVGLTMQENWLMEFLLPKLALPSLHPWTGLQAAQPSDIQTPSPAATAARWPGRLSPPLASQFAEISPDFFLCPVGDCAGSVDLSLCWHMLRGVANGSERSSFLQTSW